MDAMYLPTHATLPLCIYMVLIHLPSPVSLCPSKTKVSTLLRATSPVLGRLVCFLPSYWIRTMVEHAPLNLLGHWTVVCHSPVYLPTGFQPSLRTHAPR